MKLRVFMSLQYYYRINLTCCIDYNFSKYVPFFSSECVPHVSSFHQVLLFNEGQDLNMISYFGSFSSSC